MSARLRKIGVRLAVVVALALLLTEGFFRFALFGDGALSNRVVRALPTLRGPQNYAYPRSPEYWKLQYSVFGRGKGHESNYDRVLGWVKRDVTPETYEHADAARLAGRRPILLFGDSFADCVGDDADCWQGLLEDSELGATCALLNYGTGSYGFGQIALSCTHSLHLYEHLEPLVVVSLLVDDDLDRSVLDFRTWPKPVFDIGGDGQARLLPRQLPRTRDEFFEREGIGITSYAWRYVLFGTKLRPDAKEQAAADHLRAVFELNGAILDQLVADLEASELDYCFFLFHGKSFLRANQPYMQREEFVARKLEELGVPYALSRTALAEDARETGRTSDDYFLENGHYTPLGNEVVFRALRAAIEDRF